MSANLQVGTGTIINRLPSTASKVVVDIGTATILSRVPMGAVQPTPFWGDDPDSWEAVWLAGTRLPGFSFITGTVGIRVSRRSVPGKHGESRVQFGYEAAKLSIHLVLWTKEHLDAWNKQLRTLRPRAGRGQPGVVAISHPATTMMGISFVEVIHVSLLQMEDPGDVFTCQLDVLEHFPKPTANKAKVQAPELNAETAIPLGVTGKTPPAPSSRAPVRPSQTNGGP